MPKAYTIPWLRIILYILLLITIAFEEAGPITALFCLSMAAAVEVLNFQIHVLLVTTKELLSKDS